MSTVVLFLSLFFSLSSASLSEITSHQYVRLEVDRASWDVEREPSGPAAGCIKSEIDLSVQILFFSVHRSLIECGGLCSSSSSSLPCSAFRWMDGAGGECQRADIVGVTNEDVDTVFVYAMVGPGASRHVISIRNGC